MKFQNTFLVVSLGLSLGVTAVSSVLADPTVAATPTFAASGVLSQTTSTGYGSAKVDMPWGEDNSKTNSQAPLTGSVFRKSPREWTAKVFNNSKTDTYSASIKVTQLSVTTAPVKTDYFSVTLSPGESNEHLLTGVQNATNASLELLSWKKTKSTAASQPSDAAVTQPAETK